MTTQDLKNIVGIKVEIEAEDTGVPANFHVISALNIDLNNQLTYATISSYYSEKLYKAGKASVGSLSVTIYDVPQRGVDVFDWVYQSLVAPIAEGATDRFGNHLQPHNLTGGELVYIN